MARVHLHRDCGFCDGVRRAVETAWSLKSRVESGDEVYIIGDLVNNVRVMDSFRDAGFHICESVSDIPPRAVAVIRAHGVAPDVYEQLKQKRAEVHDCTCKLVKGVHDIVRLKSAEGYKIIIVGKADHPEVVGTVGWSVSGALVFEHPFSLSNANLSGKVCVAAQTTCNVSDWDAATALIHGQNSKAVFHNTICRIKDLRERKASAIAAACDLMLVIGDSKSSNSSALAAVCRAVCDNTHFISGLEAIKQSGIWHKRFLEADNIGVTAGTSVPDEAIAEVFGYLNEFYAD